LEIKETLIRVTDTRHRDHLHFKDITPVAHSIVHPEGTAIRHVRLTIPNVVYRDSIAVGKNGLFLKRSN